MYWLRSCVLRTAPAALLISLIDGRVFANPRELAQEHLSAVEDSTYWENRLRPFLAPRDSALQLAVKSARPKLSDQEFGALMAANRRAVGLLAFLSNDSNFQDWVGADSDGSVAAKGFLERRGLGLSWSEGMFYVAEDSGFLLRLLDKVLPPSAEEFLAYRSREEVQQFTDDDMLLIPWDSVGSRAARWEQFAKANPEFALKFEVLEMRDVYLGTYLTGLDNAPTFSESGTLDPDLRESYGRFLVRYPDTRAASIVSGYVDILRAHGYRRSRESYDYLNSKGVLDMRGRQLPTR